MSIDAMKWAWKIKKISSTQKIVLLALADRANEDAICWPSISALADACCLTTRAVVNSINSLNAKGVLERISKGCPGKTSRYRLCLDSEPHSLVNDVHDEPDSVVNDVQGDSEPHSLSIVNDVHLYSEPRSHNPKLTQSKLKENPNIILHEAIKSPRAGGEEKPKVPKPPAKKSTLPVELTEFSLPVIGDESEPEWRVPKTMLEEWQRCYPAVDVPGELMKMRSWLVSNTQRRKTKRGITRFCNSWLSKAQDNSKAAPLGRNQFYPGQPACPTEHQLRMQEERLMAEALYAKRVANGETWEQRHANDDVNQPKALEECEDVYELMENIKRKRDQACQ